MVEVSTDYGILVGVDGSAESDAAIGWATREATMRGVPITLMHVVPPIPNGRRLPGNQRSRRCGNRTLATSSNRHARPSSPMRVNPIRPTCAPKWSVRPSCRHSLTRPSTPG